MALTKTQEAYLGRAAAAVGPSRLEPYLQKEGRDLLRALARYHWNVELCKAFYPVLQALEVTLRNGIDAVAVSAFPVRPSSLDYNIIRSWLTRTNSVVVHPGGRDDVRRAMTKLASTSQAQAKKNHNDLVAALSFGFWVGMLESTYDAPGTNGVFLWPVHWSTVFPSARDIATGDIRLTFTQLRHFRNRVFHHEPIWQKRAMDVAPTARFDQAVQALRWMQPTQAQLVVRMHATLADLTDDDAIERRVESLLAAMDSASKAAAKAAADKQARKDAREAAKLRGGGRT